LRRDYRGFMQSRETKFGPTERLPSANMDPGGGSPNWKLESSHFRVARYSGITQHIEDEDISGEQRSTPFSCRI